jgi:hypothetical protein
VCANLVCCNVEGVLRNCRDGILQRVCDLLRRDVVNAVAPPYGGDGGVVGRSRVGLDLTDDGSCCTDWAQHDVAGCHLGRCVVLFVFLLHFEGDIEAISIFE